MNSFRNNFLHLVLIIAGFQFFISKLHSQSSWYWQQPQPSGNLLYSVDFINNNTGFAAGILGTIMKTTDGGVTWLLQNSGTKNDLNKVSVTDKKVGFCVGISGTILRTNDGGNMWTSQNMTKTNHLYDIFFPSFYTGYAVGLGGTILKTTDNGIRWSKFSSGTSTPLFCVKFINNNSGVIGGYNLILKTTNGGINWINQNVNIFPSSQIVGIVQLDNNTIIAASNSSSGNVYKTTNGGQNWEMYSLKLPYLFDGSVDLVRDISFLNKNTGFIVTDLGTILKTVNGGVNWLRDSTFRPSYLKLGIMKDIDVVDSNLVYLAGAGGTVFRTTNSGASWIVKSGSKKDIRGHYFINKSTCYIVGERGSILKTTDSGVSWFDLDSETDKLLHSVYFVNEKTGYTAGDSGIIMKTTDRGITWSTKTSGIFDNIYSIKFIKADIGFAACGNEANMDAKILKTTDGGENWFNIFEGISMGSLTSIEIINNKTILVAGKNGNALKTNNCGLNWTVTNIMGKDFNSISFTDSLNGLIVGNNGVIFKTSNGGLDWWFIATDLYYKLNSISYIGNIAIAAGENGTILTSSNGGTTWNEEKRISYNSFYSTDILSYNLFAFGEFGSVIKSTANNFSTNFYIQNNTAKKFIVINYPNPFNSQTILSYTLTSDKFVSIKIYDMLGKQILTLVNTAQERGMHSVTWDATQFPGGIYLYTLEVEGLLIDTGKMLLLK